MTLTRPLASTYRPLPGSPWWKSRACRGKERSTDRSAGAAKVSSSSSANSRARRRSATATSVRIGLPPNVQWPRPQYR